MQKQWLSFLSYMGVGVLCAVGAWASEPIERTNSSALWFENWGDLSNATLIVVSPEGKYTDIFNERGTPVFRLRDVSPIIDGVYSYELRAASSEKLEIKNPINNGRGKAAKSEMLKPYQINGVFIVKRGVIARKENLVEE